MKFLNIDTKKSKSFTSEDPGLDMNKDTDSITIGSGLKTIKKKVLEMHKKSNLYPHHLVKKIIGDSQNASSVSSAFNKNHEHRSAIRRVFKKSVIFLGISIFSFFLLVFLSINPFSLNPIFVLLCGILYVISVNIFYIILCDRSYLFIAILSHFLIFLLVNSFIGQLFSFVTLIGLLLILFLLYLAYLELEKIQLGSRLLSIMQLTSEASKILWIVVFLTLSIGLFNHISHLGSVKSFDKYIISNSLVWDGLIMGEATSIPLHRFIGASEGLLNEKRELLFSGFLAANYIDGKPVVPASEQSDIILACENKIGLDKCGNAILEESQSRLTRYKNEFYNDLGLELDTILDDQKLELVLKQYYKNTWAQFVVSKETKTKGDLNGFLRYIPQDLLISRVDILPAFFALGIFILLMIFRWVFVFISSIFLWVLWRLLILFKFLKIETEVVEAEVVSI
jgi:hypothetical protein